MANPILRLYIDGEQKVKVKPDVVQTIYSDYQYNFIASGSTQIERNDNVVTIFSPAVDTSTFLSIEDFNQYVIDLNINQYITDAEMSAILQTLNNEIAKKTSVLDVENIVDTYLSNYYTKAEIDLIIANIDTGDGGISSWNELTDIPVWLNHPTLSSFENNHTHDYNSLRNKPIIPTLLSQLTNDTNFITLNDIPTIPSDISQLSDNTNLLFDKDYNSLTNKPVIPTRTSDLLNDSGYITIGDIPTIPTDVNQLNDVSGLFFDRDYNSLINKPVIPSVPTATSDLFNDSGYITLNDIPTIPTDVNQLNDNSNLLFDKDYNSLNNKPTIPTSTSQLTNDSNFINDLSSHSATELSDISSVGSGSIITSAERTKLNNALVEADKGDTVATLDVNQKLVQEVDASKITSGTIDIQRLPAGALERLIEVDDETERFSLTTNDVQNGDTVKQLDTGVMYRVVDDLNLNNSLGYKEYVAGRAAAVDWSGVENKPSFHAVATSGNYNDLLNKPSIPSDVNELSDSSNLLFDKNYNSLTNKPSIPTKTSDLLNDSGYITISDIPTIPTDISDLSDNSNLLFDKNYNSLTNKPTLGSIASHNVWNGTQAQYDALGTYNANTIYLIDEE